MAFDHSIPDSKKYSRLNDFIWHVFHISLKGIMVTLKHLLQSTSDKCHQNIYGRNTTNLSKHMNYLQQLHNSIDLNSFPKMSIRIRNSIINKKCKVYTCQPVINFVHYNYSYCIFYDYIKKRLDKTHLQILREDVQNLLESLNVPRKEFLQGYL